MITNSVGESDRLLGSAEKDCFALLRVQAKYIFNAPLLRVETEIYGNRPRY
jgi:hypothetical protein